MSAGTWDAMPGIDPAPWARPWELPPSTIAARLAQLGHPLFPRAGNPTVVSVRAYSRLAGAWDDAHAVLWHDERGALTGIVGRGTTDASREYLLGELPGNPDGTAMALPGHHRLCWRVGPNALHGRSRGRPYPAWEQVGPIAFVRDNDRDEILDLGTTGYADSPTALAMALNAITLGRKVYRHVIKLNMHRGPSSPTETIGPWSAACAVWLDRSAYSEALGVCTRAIPRYGSRVSWTLLDQWWGLPISEEGDGG